MNKRVNEMAREGERVDEIEKERGKEMEKERRNEKEMERWWMKCTCRHGDGAD